MIATTVKQSRKLVELGISTDTADMCYSNDGTAIKIDANSYNIRVMMWKDYVAEVIPAWSVDELLKMLPTSISNDYVGDMDGKDYYLFMDRDKYVDGVVRFEVFYADMDLNVIEQYSDVELVNALFSMIVRLKELRKI